MAGKGPFGVETWAPWEIWDPPPQMAPLSACASKTIAKEAQGRKSSFSKSVREGGGGLSLGPSFPNQVNDSEN